MLVDALRATGTIVIGIAAFVAAIGVLVRAPFVRRPVLWLWRRIVAEPLGAWFAHLIDARITAKLLEPNGGKSLSDIATEVAHLKEHLGVAPLKDPRREQ